MGVPYPYLYFFFGHTTKPHSYDLYGVPYPY